MSSEPESDLHLQGVEVSLPDGRPLFRVPSFTIKAGEHLLVQGESGSGKTTFLHLIAGLFRPLRGEVHWGSRNLTRWSDDDRARLRRREIGVVFQKLNLLDHLTIGENLRLAAADDAAATMALERVRLKNREAERCAHLSLGEQQRVAIARVLAQRPSLILADEPTSSLDEANTRFVMEALKEAARGRTLIVVSHDHRVTEFFDRTIPFREFAP